MDRRSPARLLAPTALVIVAFALVAMLARAGGSDDPVPSLPGARPSATPAKAAKRRTTRARPSRPVSYRVKAGDTPSSIAESTGVGIERLTELNPDLDPQTLAVGQRVKLR